MRLFSRQSSTTGPPISSAGLAPPPAPPPPAPLLRSPPAPPVPLHLPKAQKGPDFSKLLDGVVFVLSGFVNPERSTLRSQALDMGAEYQPDWTSDCTLLVCAFANTLKFRQVQANNGTIISKITWRYPKSVKSNFNGLMSSHPPLLPQSFVLFMKLSRNICSKLT